MRQVHGTITGGGSPLPRRSPVHLEQFIVGAFFTSTMHSAALPASCLRRGGLSPVLAESYVLTLEVVGGGWELAECCSVDGRCPSVRCVSNPPGSATAAIRVAGRSTRAACADARSPRLARPLSVATAGRPTSS